MNIRTRYLELKDEYDAACQALSALAYVLKDTGRRLDHRPNEKLDFALPTNEVLEAAQDRRTAAREAAMEAWAAIPEAQRANLVPPR